MLKYFKRVFCRDNETTRRRTKKEIEKLKELKNEINQHDAKIDGAVQAKFDEKSQEESDRKLRRNNVIVFGLDECSESDQNTRIEFDMAGMTEIMHSLKCEGPIKHC